MDNNFIAVRFDDDTEKYMPLTDFFQAPSATINGQRARFSDIEVS